MSCCHCCVFLGVINEKDKSSQASHCVCTAHVDTTMRQGPRTNRFVLFCSPYVLILLICLCCRLPNSLTRQSEDVRTSFVFLILLFPLVVPARNCTKQQSVPSFPSRVVLCAEEHFGTLVVSWTGEPNAYLLTLFFLEETKAARPAKALLTTPSKKTKGKSKPSPAKQFHGPIFTSTAGVEMTSEGRLITQGGHENIPSLTLVYCSPRNRCGQPKTMLAYTPPSVKPTLPSAFRIIIT